MDLSTLSPEDKDQLLMKLIEKYQGDSGGMEHPDAAEDVEQMEPVFKVLELLINKVEEVENRLQKLECVVMDDLIGGIEGLYKSNTRAQGIKDIQGKYGHLFDPHMDAIKELEPDSDLYDALYEMLDSVKGADPEWNDEKELSSVSNFATSIGDRIGKIRGSAPPPEAPATEGEPEGSKPEEGTEVKATVVEATGGPDEKLMEKIRGMQKKNKDAGRSSPF